jgi:hypothetical protein
MQFTLGQLFGEGASQTNTNLIIQKSALYGLTPSLNNRAEQLLAALILTASRNFFGVLEDENSNPITNEIGLSIDFDNSDLYGGLVIEQWKTLIVEEKVKHTFLINQFQLYED